MDANLAPKEAARHEESNDTKFDGGQAASPSHPVLGASCTREFPEYLHVTHILLFLFLSFLTSLLFIFWKNFENFRENLKKFLQKAGYLPHNSHSVSEGGCRLGVFCVYHCILRYRMVLRSAWLGCATPLVVTFCEIRALLQIPPSHEPGSSPRAPF